VVVKIDEAPIKSSTALIEYVGRKRPGDKLNLTINRKGKLVTLPATLVINTQTNKREFVNGEVGEGQLEKMIESVKK